MLFSRVTTFDYVTQLHEFTFLQLISWSQSLMIFYTDGILCWIGVNCPTIFQIKCKSMSCCQFCLCCWLDWCKYVKIQQEIKLISAFTLTQPFSLWHLFSFWEKMMKTHQNEWPVLIKLMIFRVILFDSMHWNIAFLKI